MRRGGRIAALCVALLAAPSSGSAADLAEERRPACLACHGTTGVSETPGVPSLGGQPPDYLLVQLVLFRDKQRVADPMNAMADGLSDDDLRVLADGLGKLDGPKPSSTSFDAAATAKGHDLAVKYRCNSCHGADFAGQDQIPRLAGQREEYLAKSLAAYKSNARAGYEPAMNEAAQDVQADDIPILAAYLARYDAKAAAR